MEKHRKNHGKLAINLLLLAFSPMERCVGCQTPQTSQLGYAVTGGLWAAASLLSFMVSICTPLPFLYTSVQVWICHSYFLLRLHTHSKTFSFRRRLTTLCLLDLFFEIQLLWRPLFRDTPSSVKKLGATHFAQPPFRCFLQIDSEQ